MTGYVPLSEAIALGIPIAAEDPVAAGWLADVAVGEALTASPAQRARQAGLYRWEADFITQHGHVETLSNPDRVIEGEDARPQGQLFVWAADVLDDPSLSAGLCDLLPADVVGPQLADLHKFRSPHPLVVDWFDDWSCQACNTHHDDGAVGVRIGEHEDFSTAMGFSSTSAKKWRRGKSEALEYPLIYCPECIAMAAQAAAAGVVR